MGFRIGHMDIAVVGRSAVAEHMRRILCFVSNDRTHCDLAFEFVDECPARSGTPYIALDDYDVGSDRFRVTEKLFCYEVCPHEDPIRVFVAPRHMGTAKAAKYAIHKSWRYLHTHGGRLYLYHLKRFVFYIYMPALELGLLRQRCTLAHCSAVEKDGEALLFAAWGGVGKTAIMSQYVEDGWNFLADDSCVICADGSACIHPLPMHIYKYHEVASPELVKRMLSRMSTSERLLWHVLSPLKRKDRLVRWIEAERVFGQEKMSHQGKISKVIYMHRHIHRRTYELKEVSAQSVAELMGSTILDEINNLANMSLVVRSCRPDSIIPSIGELYDTIVDIYRQAFTGAQCYTIAVPEQATGQETLSFLRKHDLG